MTSKLAEILQSLDGLSPEERALLVRHLLDSLDDPTNEDVDQAWLAVAERRFAELKSGKVPGVSWSQIRESLPK